MYAMRNEPKQNWISIAFNRLNKPQSVIEKIEEWNNLMEAPASFQHN